MRWIVNCPAERKLRERIVRTQGIYGYRMYRHMCLGWVNRLDDRELFGQGIPDLFDSKTGIARMNAEHPPRKWKGER